MTLLTIAQAARDVLAVYDRIEELKTADQNIVQRLVILDPLINEFKARLETLRDALERGQ